MHEGPVPQNRPYRNPVTATFSPHGQSLGLLHGGVSIVRQHTICLVLPYFYRPIAVRMALLNERVKASPRLSIFSLLSSLHT